MSMNEQGFAKSPIYKTITGDTIENFTYYLCCNGQHHHHFEGGRMMQKEDILEGGRIEVVMYNVYYCRHCLLHVYSETQRFDMQELKRAMSESDDSFSGSGNGSGNGGLGRVM